MSDNTVKQQILFYNLTRHPGPAYNMFSKSNESEIVENKLIRIKFRLIIQSKLKLLLLIFETHVHTTNVLLTHVCTVRYMFYIYRYTQYLA